MPVPVVKEVNGELEKLNRRSRFPLTNFQQKQIAEATPYYIYNVSPIDEWQRFQGQLGTLTIKKRPEGKLVSEPLIIPGIVPRRYDKGLGRLEWFLDSGLEIAEDLCGSSKDYPVENANNNLVNFGCFITEEPFEELPKKEQERLLSEANERLVGKLRERILQADQYWAQEGTKGWVAKIHHEALRAFNDITGAREERPWAPIRHTIKASEECQFCGHSNKAGVAKCANCHEVIDAELYAKLKKQAKGD